MHTYHPHSGVMTLSAKTDNRRPPETRTRRQYLSAFLSRGFSMNLYLKVSQLHSHMSYDTHGRDIYRVKSL